MQSNLSFPRRRAAKHFVSVQVLRQHFILFLHLDSNPACHKEDVVKAIGEPFKTIV